jgi:hypothetical protein
MDLSPGMRTSLRKAARDRLLAFLALVAMAMLLAMPEAARSAAQARATRRAFLAAPIWVYNNWSAYDELSDSVPLTETLALRELDEILRLRQSGVRFDYYMMDAFWYDPAGGYRTWRRDAWPQGPGRWLADCKENGIKPGLWFGTNSLTHMTAAAAWRGSLNASGTAMSFYAGGFLADFMAMLQAWYDRGIRMFKFDFADFTVAAAGDEGRLSPEAIRARNVAAFRQAMLAFRRRNPDAVLVAFNGFGGDLGSTATALPFADPVDARWLDVFDSLFAGDPRPSDVPEMNFWRSMDIYSDHMVRRFEDSGIPLERIDSTSFMIGNTGTNYFRRVQAWQGMLLLMVARGGWINTVHGNLEFLDGDKARWFAKVQRLSGPL